MVEKRLNEAKDQTLVAKEEALAVEAWASKAIKEAVKAFKSGVEYYQEVLVSCRDAFW